MKKIILVFASAVFTLSAFAAEPMVQKIKIIFEGKEIESEIIDLIIDSKEIINTIPASDTFVLSSENREVENFQNDGDPDKCLNGRLDAENYHGKKTGHFVMGALFGPFAIIGTALANPTPEKGKETYMLSKNKDQFNDPVYLSCYRKKAKSQLIGAEALGWAAWILLIAVF
jgi:hypothetical protein